MAAVSPAGTRRGWILLAQPLSASSRPGPKVPQSPAGSSAVTIPTAPGWTGAEKPSPRTGGAEKPSSHAGGEKKPPPRAGGAAPVLQKQSWLLLVNCTCCRGTIIVYKFILSPERLRLTFWRKGNAPSQNISMNFRFIISKRYFPSIKCTFNRFETNPSNSNRITIF